MQFSSGRRRHALPTIVAVALSLVGPSALPPAAFAQDDTAAAAPSSVARIDALGGDVAIQRGDDNATLAAAPNAPVLDGDYVTTGPDGRAEVGFDGRSALRIGANAQLRLVNVDPANRQIQLAAGTVELRLFGDTDGRSGIDTPSVSIVPRTAGSFRIAVDANGETSVSVRAGRVDVETPQGDQSLEPGTTLLADGPAANPSIQTQPAIALDDFDAYNSGRDQIYLAATAEGQYVNTNIAGIGDLNGSGNWVDDGSYGYVWMPTNVAPGWAPYRNGNWTWEDGFGWTWVAAFAGRPAAAIRTPFSEQQASVARVTHVAYRPAATYATGTPSNDPWQRYNGNRSAALPAYAQPQYHRPAAPAYAEPQYSRQAAPASHPQARPTHANDGHNR